MSANLLSGREVTAESDGNEVLGVKAVTDPQPRGTERGVGG